MLSEKKESYQVIGLMSGTSLDGLDIAYCHFLNSDNKWSFEIVEAETIPYTEEWKQRLAEIENHSALEYAKNHVELGHFIGKLVHKFIQTHKITVDFIASHGHTVFHQPEIGFTAQIGDGNAIAAQTKLPVIFDFRSLDVALSGQGAPLVPIGDKLLFYDYHFCLNLGGIANISFFEKDERIAFDISPCNMALNNMAADLGLVYDPHGENARKGNLNLEMLRDLNNLPFYRQLPPKSLGKEWYVAYFKPVLNQYNISVFDKLRTIIEHIALQISRSIHLHEKGKILVTGGGAFNRFLIERISDLSEHEIVIPPEKIINYKEALIFAFLGVLRTRNEINCLPSATGAKQPCCGGTIVNEIIFN